MKDLISFKYAQAKDFRTHSEFDFLFPKNLYLDDPRGGSYATLFFLRIINAYV